MSALTDAIAAAGPDAVAAAIRNDPAWSVFNLLWEQPSQIAPACEAMGWTTLEQVLAWVQATSAAIGDGEKFARLVDPEAPAQTQWMREVAWPKLHEAIHATGLLASDCMLHNSDGHYHLPTKAQWEAIAAACPAKRHKHSGNDELDCFGSTHPVQSKIDGVVAWKTIEQVHRAHQSGKDVQVLDKSGGWQYVINSVRKESAKPVIAIGVKQGIAICTEDHQIMGPTRWVDAGCGDVAPKALHTPDYGRFDAVPTELAWSYGLFCADGHARIKPGGTKYINIISIVREYVDRAKTAFNEAFHNTFVTPVWASDQVGNVRGNATLRNTQHRLQFSPQFGRGRGGPPDKFAKERNTAIFDAFAAFYDEDANKIVPRFMFGQSDEVIRAFLDGYYAGNGVKNDAATAKVTVPSALLASQLMELYARVGVTAHAIPYKNKRAFDIRLSGSDILYRMGSMTHEDGVVYDITTTTGEFASGSLVTHNCDDHTRMALGWLSSKGLGNTAAAFTATRHYTGNQLTGGHAVVLVWDDTLTPHQWEPQRGTLHPVTFAKLGGNFLATRVEYARIFA